MRYDARKDKDLASNAEAQRSLALWVLEAEGRYLLVDLYRARPRAVEGTQTRLLGQRGPTGSIVSGDAKSVQARFSAKRLRVWADAWLAAHGAVAAAPPLPADEEFVTEYLLKHGLPLRFHPLLKEEV